MPYFTTVTPTHGAPAEIWKNPTASERRKELGAADTARAFLVGDDIYLWAAASVLHHRAKESLGFNRQAIPLILYFAPGEVDVYVTDASFDSDHFESPRVASLIRSHPYFAKQKLKVNEITYWNDLLVGDWEKLPPTDSVGADQEHSSGERVGATAIEMFEWGSSKTLVTVFQNPNLKELRELTGVDPQHRLRIVMDKNDIYAWESHDAIHDTVIQYLRGLRHGTLSRPYLKGDIYLNGKALVISVAPWQIPSEISHVEDPLYRSKHSPWETADTVRARVVDFIAGLPWFKRKKWSVHLFGWDRWEPWENDNPSGSVSGKRRQHVGVVYDHKVILYVGQTRGAKTMKACDVAGIRELTQRTSMPPRRTPWALDNGCYEDSSKGRPFNSEQFKRACQWAQDSFEKGTFPLPDFVVLPDIVRGGLESLVFSRDWYRAHAANYPDLPWYFVVQDRMTPANIDLSWGRFAGIFIGGSLPWKFRTGETWVKWAHQQGIRCHIGRATEKKRIWWARRIGADSIDGNGPLFTDKDLQDTIRFLNDPMPPELF